MRLWQEEASSSPPAHLRTMMKTSCDHSRRSRSRSPSLRSRSRSPSPSSSTSRSRSTTGRNGFEIRSQRGMEEGKVKVQLLKRRRPTQKETKELIDGRREKLLRMNLFAPLNEIEENGIETEEAAQHGKEGHKLTQLALEDERAKAYRLKQQGNSLAEAGKFRQAMGKWHEGLEYMPHDASLYELQAQACMELHEDFKAVQMAEKAVQLDPSWVEAHHTLARALRNFGEVELSAQSYDKALELDASNESLRLEAEELASLLTWKQKLQEIGQVELSKTKKGDEIQVQECKNHLSLRGRMK